MRQAAPAGLRIGEVARRTGIPVATIRAWEARYDLLRPQRTSGGQRLYRQEDVDILVAVRERIEAGWLVSAAAAELRGSEPAAEPEPVAEPQASGTRPLPPAVDRGATFRAIDPGVLHLAYGALRAMVTAGEPTEVRDALVELVIRLGGEVVPATSDDGSALPLDLSFGQGPPLLPRAGGDAVVQLRLETVLPGLVEDGRDLVAELGQAARQLTSRV